MSNNFRRTASLLRILHALEDLEPLFLNFLYICLQESPRNNYRKIYGKSKASLSRNLSTGTPPKFFYYNLLLCSFSPQFIFFFSEQPFNRNYSTLDSHTNTVISGTRLPTRQDGVENRDKVYYLTRAKLFSFLLK